MARRGEKYKGGKKHRKIGRTQKYCDYYRQAGLQEKNRIRRIKRHLRKHPEDAAALEALNER
jgi:hypothetical protein